MRLETKGWVTQDFLVSNLTQVSTPAIFQPISLFDYTTFADLLIVLDGTWATAACWTPESGIPYKESIAALNNISEVDTETPVEQFWRYVLSCLAASKYPPRNEVLHASEGIEEVGPIQADLFGCLIVAWALVYGFIWKGLHNSGKVYDAILCCFAVCLINFAFCAFWKVQKSIFTKQQEKSLPLILLFQANHFHHHLNKSYFHNLDQKDFQRFPLTGKSVSLKVLISRM